ncbi:MAG: hypothetical protein J5614_09170 [Paludibacteraceae bacterium]|nr:hypothetical protein [Paludibacteraceae bacterium]
MSMDKVQLKQEELLDGQVVLSDINPVTNTKSIEDSANGLPMTETISRMWSAINNKLSRIVNSVNGRTGVVVLTSEDVGLGNVDNVSYEEIKQWVLDTFDELFGEGHFRLYPSLTAAKVDATSHGKEYNNIPFYAQSGEPIIKDIGGTPTTIDDYRAYIGYFIWNSSTGHVEIGDKKAINVVGWSDNSIVYVKDEDETFRGNTTPLPIGGIGVNIHVNEDALFVRNPGSVKSESGLAIDKTKLVPRVYYFENMYKKSGVALSGFLWDDSQSTDNKGAAVSISVDGDDKTSAHYLYIENTATPPEYRVGDIVICTFRSGYHRNSGSGSGTLVLDPEPIHGDPSLMFRNTCIGRFDSAPSIDYQDAPYSISFNSIVPVVGYGLKLMTTHKDETKTDVEIGINIPESSINVRSTSLGGTEDRMVPYNSTPLMLRTDTFYEQDPENVVTGDGKLYYVDDSHWNTYITAPWGFDEGGSMGHHMSSGPGIHLNMDQTLCLMPMSLVRAGNVRTNVSPYGDEYKFQPDHGSDRTTRPFGSLVANNWHHPYVFYADSDTMHDGSFNNTSLLSVNLSKIIARHGPVVHGSTQSFYNVSGLRVTYMTDVAYNGNLNWHDGNPEVIGNLANITDAFNDANRDNYFGIIDGFDTDGTEYDKLIPKEHKYEGRDYRTMSSGLSVNVGKYLEIHPEVTKNSQEYYNGGKVQVRIGHGVEETCYYWPLFIAGNTQYRGYEGLCKMGFSVFEKMWEKNIDNSDKDYQFYCIPAYLTEFIQQKTENYNYEDWLCDEEPFLRDNIEEIPVLPVFTLADETWLANSPEYYHMISDEPDDWDTDYSSYFEKNYDGSFSNVQGVGDDPQNLEAPDWDAEKYYTRASEPDDWVSKILVDTDVLNGDSHAYDFTFGEGYNDISPFDLTAKNTLIPGHEDEQTYHAIWYTKDGDNYVPVSFEPTGTIVESLSGTLEYRASNHSWEPGLYYKLTAQRVDYTILRQTHTILWKRGTNRLGVKPDRKTMSIKSDGSVGIVSVVVPYEVGAVYHKNQMVEYNNKVYICIKDYFTFEYTEYAKRTAEAMNNRAGYTDEPTYLDPATYGVYKAYHAVRVDADMEAGYLSNRFAMEAVVEWEQGQSYAYGQLVQYMGYLYLVIKSYGDYKSISIEDDIDNGYLSDAFNTSKRKILYFRDIRGRSFEFDPMGTIKQRNNEERFANDPEKLRRIREYEYVKLGPGLRITGGTLPPEVECNKTELRASLLEEVERMSVAEEIMYARTLDPTFGTSAKFEYQSVEEQNSVVFTPGSQYTMGQYVRSGSYLYLCIKNYDSGDPPYTASDSAATDVLNGYLAEYSKIYNNAGTIEALTSIEDVMNMDQSFLATIETVGEDVDEAIIKNTVLSKDSTLTELRTFKATLDTIRMQLEDPKVFFPMNKEYLLDDWRTLQSRVRAMVLTANNKKDASTTLYPALIQEWFGNGSTVQPTFKAIQAATNDFLQVEIRTLEWLFTTWATMVRNSFELAATFVEDQNINKCDYCACGDADVICNHECAHCTKNPENNENAYWAYVQVDTGTTHDAVVYDSLNTETHRELFRIPYGTRVVCIPLNSVSDWVKVALNGQIGYALKSNFKLPQVFAQIGETVISASVNIFDTYDGTGKGITLYDDSMMVSEETKIGVFHTNVTNIPRSGTAPDQRQWEILSSEWTRITLLNDDGQGYTTGYVETARMIFS